MHENIQNNGFDEEGKRLAFELEEKKNIAEIEDEFHRGFEFIKNYQKSVSFFGSARFTSESEHYQFAYKLSRRIAAELKYAVVTGGGPGIMEAANKGAREAGGVSLAITIRLNKEQKTNPYVDKSEDFYYFFVRKTMLSFSAEAYLFFPGGFGTLDEFFEIITLIQTHKIPRIPLILIGKDYWEPLNAFITSNLLGKHKAIDNDDTSLYTITEDEEEIMNIVRSAPNRPAKDTSYSK